MKDSQQSAYEAFDKLMLKAVSHHNAGQLSEAIDSYQEILRSYPDNPAALHNLGVIALNQFDLSQAMELIGRAHLIAPHEPELRNIITRLGMTLYANNFWEQAQYWLRLSLDHDPTNDEVREALSRIAPRDYLEPEVFCEARGETLQRYSPREAENYVYVIDIVGTCNLRCPTCPVGNYGDAIRPKGFMTFDMYQQILKKIAEENPGKQLELFLFNWGEPLLHPELARFIELANEYSFRVTLSTNLNIKTDLEPMIKANPAAIKISLSGFTEETYSKTHSRGKLDLLKSNIFKLRQLLDKYDSNTKVYVGHHIYHHNADQYEEVSSLCRDIGFLHSPIQAFFQPLEKLKQVIDGELDSSTIPVLDLLQLHPRERYERLKEVRTENYDCELRFNQTVINHDGSVALCCGVYDQPNMLGVNFLDMPGSEINLKKYQHSFCKTCKEFEMDYSPSSVS